MSETKEELTLEETFDQLKTLLNTMETSELSLEDNFKLYEQGLELVKACNDKLDKIEKKLITLEETK